MTALDEQAAPFRLDPPWRWAAAVTAMLAAAAHLPVLPDHLAEAPYMGLAFAVFALAGLALAAVVLIADSPAVYRALASLTIAAVLAYAATRLVAFPQLADDVGAWGDPWGLVSVAAEVACVACCWFALTRSSIRDSDNSGEEGALNGS